MTKSQRTKSHWNHSDADVFISSIRIEIYVIMHVELKSQGQNLTSGQGCVTPPVRSRGDKGKSCFI